MVLIAVGVLHSAALAPLPPLSDTLALGAAAPAGSGGTVIRYGWLRGCSSAAFALGLVLSGRVIGHFGIVVIVWLNAVLLAAAAPMALGVPQLLAAGGHARTTSSQARGLVPPVVTYFVLTYDLGFSIPMLIGCLIGGASWCLALYLGPETKGKEMFPDLVLA